MSTKNHQKSSKKKISWKPIVLSTVLLGTVGLTVGLSVDWRFPSFIYISGSSTMQQVLQSISNIYPYAEVIADAGGSSQGIQNVVRQKKNIGSSSKTPSVSIAGLPKYNNHPAKEGKYSQQWSELKIKTVTMAWDGIGIVYKDNSQVLGDKDIIITPKTIIPLYLAFAGISQVNAKNLLPSTTSWETATSNTSIVPFARLGGAFQSGTGEAFLVDSGLVSKNELKKYNANTDSEPKPSENVPDGESIYYVLNAGTYGRYTQQTSESNLQTWLSLKDASDPGVILSYFSSGFIKSNYHEITRAGFKVALYAKDLAKPFPLIDNNNNFNVAKGYDWYRPMNLILSANSQNYVKEYIQWIIGNSYFPKSEFIKAIELEGFIHLQDDAITTMFSKKNPVILKDLKEYVAQHPDSNYDEFLKEKKNTNPEYKGWDDFWESNDYHLIQSEQYNERENNHIWYGAYNPQSKTNN